VNRTADEQWHRLGFGVGIDLDAKAKKNEAQEVTLPGLES